jgi:predicted Zn-dependent peptidase
VSIRKTLLPGGLRVVTEQVSGVRSVAVGVWVNVGSRDETRPQAGASHYLEHLLFKGTSTRSALEISSAIEAVGGEMNAFTGKEYTCFYARVLDVDAPLAIDILSDLITSSVVSKEDVDAERGVVLEEIAMRDDDPSDLVHDIFAEALFGDTALGRPILGTVDSISSITRSVVNGYYRRRYLPEDLVVSIAGNIDHELVVDLVHKGFDRDGFLAEHVARPVKKSNRPIKTSGGIAQIFKRETEQANIVLGMPGIARHDDRRFTLSVLNAALGGGMSSRLFQEIREKRGLAYSVYSYSQQFADAGQVGVYVGCQPQKVHEVLEICRDLLGEVGAHGLTADEVERGKGQVRGGMVLSLEDTGSRMSRMGKSELVFGEQMSVDEIIERVTSVTVDDVRSVANELLTARPTLAVVGPFSSREQRRFDRAVS